MSYSPALGSTISNTKMRTPENISPYSGTVSYTHLDVYKRQEG